MGRIPSADPIGRALAAESGDATERITQLWHEYRDEEKATFDLYFLDFTKEGTVDWDEYKAMFSRFPSFPNWLRARGHRATGS